MLERSPLRALPQVTATRLFTCASPAAAFQSLCGRAWQSGLFGAAEPKTATSVAPSGRSLPTPVLKDKQTGDSWVCLSPSPTQPFLIPHAPGPHFFHQVGRGSGLDRPPALVAVSPGPGGLDL